MRRFLLGISMIISLLVSAYSACANSEFRFLLMINLQLFHNICIHAVTMFIDLCSTLFCEPSKVAILVEFKPFFKIRFCINHSYFACRVFFANFFFATKEQRKNKKKVVFDFVVIISLHPLKRDILYIYICSFHKSQYV